MPTFCRHNRFVERCPICSRTLPGVPGAEPATGAGRRPARGGASAARGASAAGHASGASGTGRHNRRLRAAGREVRVQRETRAADDGYSNELVPGLRASADAERLAQEIAFAAGRLQWMHAAPPGLFGEMRALAGEGELERATWVCFLTVYLSPLQESPLQGPSPQGAPLRESPLRGSPLQGSPLQGSPLQGSPLQGSRPQAPPLQAEDPFAGVRLVLERERMLVAGDGSDGVARDWDSPLDGVPLGPRTSHDPDRGSQTLRAYRQWALNSGSQVQAIVGEQAWTPERRFERAFERLALPGFGRMGRYELLVTLGRLELYELRAGSLHLASGRGMAADDLTTIAAKRILAVGEPIYLERRAQAFAEELSVPIDALDLAFANWAAAERATLGFKDDVSDHHTLEHVRRALGLEEK